MIHGIGMDCKTKFSGEWNLIFHLTSDIKDENRYLPILNSCVNIYPLQIVIMFTERRNRHAEQYRDPKQNHETDNQRRGTPSA